MQYISLIFDWAPTIAGTLAIAVLLGWNYIVAGWKWMRGAGASAVTAGADNRGAYNAALCLLADRNSLTKCPTLKKNCDDAITELSKMVVRAPEYQPLSEVKSA